MEGIPAVVLTHDQLSEMLESAGQRAAELAVKRLRSELQQSPEQATLERLRGYLADPATVADPRSLWAHSGIIREVQPTPRGKPKSVAWFMKFQRETGLKDCSTRRSPTHGRRKEWTFADIGLAWGVYYGR
ncbi:hypothetical protein [Oricola sp.]|uniref:hypothetical protein n=1 Tax=Oricola sp. TaxID=1979950 RepID=UPI0025CDF94A|nr:hypothetical protein [Oricola sp.]MCI5076862.1 hypothetical protein [Oricola sp.]